jgi:hypothetical protein
MYPTEKREGTWTLKEMESTREGRMGEGPALQARRKISSSSAAEKWEAPPFSNQEDWKKSPA